MFMRYISGISTICLFATLPLAAGDKSTPPEPTRLGSARFANLGRVFAVAYSDDGRLLAGGAWDGSIRIWETATGKELRRLDGHSGPVRKLAFSPEGKRLTSAGAAPGVCRRDIESGKRTVLGSSKMGRDVAFAPDGKHLAAIADGTLFVWDQAGKLLWKDGKDRVHSNVVFVGPDIVASAYYKTAANRFARLGDRVHLGRWELSTGKELTTRALEQNLHPPWPILGPGELVVQRTRPERGQRDVIRWSRAGRWDVERRIVLREEDVSVLCISPDGRMLALSGNSLGSEVKRVKFIRVFETATGLERCRFRSIDQGQLSLAFAPDGRTLASGSLDVTVLLWDLTLGEITRKQPLTEADFAAWWDDLHSRDAAVAYRAQWRLVAAAEGAVPRLAKRLRPVPTPNAGRTAALIRDLGDERFDTRTAAYAQLLRMEDLAEPALRAGLKEGNDLETRRRLEALLQRIDTFSPERLAELRAIEVLERVRTPTARALLRVLATGCPAASSTRAARETLRRLHGPE